MNSNLVFITHICPKTKGWAPKSRSFPAGATESSRFETKISKWVARLFIFSFPFPPPLIPFAEVLNPSCYEFYMVVAGLNSRRLSGLSRFCKFLSTSSTGRSFWPKSSESLQFRLFHFNFSHRISCYAEIYYFEMNVRNLKI